MNQKKVIKRNIKKSKSLKEMCEDLVKENENSHPNSSDEIISLSSSSTSTSRKSRPRNTFKSHVNLLENEKKQLPSFESHKESGSLYMNYKDNRRLTDGMNVLSWDCGITNLCYCLLEKIEGENEFRIIMWENFSLNSQTIMQATEKLVKELDSRPWMAYVDYVCIENQVLKNVQMKVIAHVIQCYFVIKAAARARENSVYTSLPNGTKVARRGKSGPPVHLVKAESKFTVAGDIKIPDRIEKLQRRRRNKQAAIYIAEQMLRNRGYTTEVNFLTSFEKRDDYSDSFLQGLYFLRLMQKRQERRIDQRKKLKKFMGMSEERGQTITIGQDETTGTRDEKYNDDDGINEGCEYEKEIPLPQVYQCKTFIIPQYDNIAEISRSTRYKRKNK